MNYCNECNKDLPFYALKHKASAYKLLKYVVIMKLILFITVLSLNVSAAVKAQRITISVQNARLDEVMSAVRKQSGYFFFLDHSDLKTAKPVTVNLKNATIEETLQAIFTNQPLKYEFSGKTILLTLKEAAAKRSVIDIEKKFFTDLTINGKVIDEKGQPLTGATVIIKGTQQGAVTDYNGKFSIQNAPGNGNLIISMIGRESKEIVYKNGEIATIILKEVDKTLKEVIIAYGKIEEKFSTGNISSVSGDVISRQPVSNPLLALQSRAPGLFIRPNSSLNTSNINVTVQGRNSLTKGNQPFYVIDGIPYTPDAITAGLSMMGSIGSGTVSNLNFINPSEIESITVLKDADATAIYGSRASNGVILITTKKGKAGQTKVDLNLQTGWGRIANKADLLNTKQYLELRREAILNGNQTTGDFDFDVNGVWDTTRNIDWQKELIGATSKFQNLQASVSGGNERTQFLAGAGQMRETPVFNIGNFSNVRTSINFNVNSASANQNFRFFLSGSYLQGNNKLPQNDPTNYATKLAPDAPRLYNPDGLINWAPNTDFAPFQTFENPAALMLQTYTAQTNNLIGNSQISYELIPGMQLKSNFGFNRLETNEIAKFPTASIKPEDRFYGVKPYASFSDKNIESWIIEPQLTYKKTYSFGTIDGLLGSTFQNTDNYLLAFSGEQYNSDAQLNDLNAAGNKTVIGSLQSTYRYNAIFGRLNYRYKDRYIINLSARRDGSSRFGSDNLFNSFYSVGGAWLLSEEDFFNNALPFINYGKLRATYGTTGNDQIGDYQFYSLYDNVSVSVPYLGYNALSPRGLSNPYLQWEETRKLNVGFDLGLFENRILINTNYFHNRSSNQLLSKALSFVTGFGGLSRNLPATVQNTGWEFTIDYTPIKGNGFDWHGTITLTLPKNKLIKYDGLETSNDKNRFVIGQSINLIKVYSFIGVNSETGLYQFRDSKGELTSDPANPTDRYAIINPDPSFYGGFSNTFSYQGFELDIFFQFVKQIARSNRFGNYPGTSFNENHRTNVLNHWKKTGDQTDIQKVSTGFDIFNPLDAASQSNAAYESASFARLKNASLSYTFTSSLVKKAHISNARIYIQGQNLLTITKFLNGDPETIYGTLGTIKMFTVGTQLTF